MNDGIRALAFCQGACHRWFRKSKRVGLMTTNGEDAIDLVEDSSLIRQAALFARRLQADYMHRIKGTGLTPSQANALRALYIAPCASQVELAGRMEVGKAHAGQVLKSLEKAALVSRERSEANRRSITIVLTPGGQAMVAILADAATLQQQEIHDAMGDPLATILAVALNEANRFTRPADGTGEVS